MPGSLIHIVRPCLANDVQASSGCCINMCQTRRRGKISIVKHPHIFFSLAEVVGGVARRGSSTFECFEVRLRASEPEKPRSLTAVTSDLCQLDGGRTKRETPILSFIAHPGDPFISNAFYNGAELTTRRQESSYAFLISKSSAVND